MKAHRIARLTHIVLAALLASGATAAQAEQLQFDHRLYPPLKQVLDGGDANMVMFDSHNPKRLIDLIAIKGKSAKDWIEAFEIIATVPVAKVGTAEGWMAVQRDLATKSCKADYTIIAQDEVSITYERRTPHCRAERAEFGIYRLITGKRSWFQLAALSKQPITAEAREALLALLASAHLK